VAEGRPATGYPTFADGHDSMLVCDAVARSSRERRWIEVKR
jgi:predicted dehydrogenase